MFNLLLFAFLAYPLLTTGQIKTSTSTSTSTTTRWSTTTTIPPWADPTMGGKPSNPGAQIHLTNKTISAVTTYALDSISASIRNISIPDITFPNYADTLTVKSFRVNEAKFTNVQNQFQVPNRIQTRFYGGKLAATGYWSYKWSGDKTSSNGTFRVVVVNGEIKLVNQVARTTDGARPFMDNAECKPDFRQFRVEIEGAPNKVSVVENCTTPFCNKIRSHFDDIVCAIVRNFIKENINRPLATFPNRVRLNCSSQFFVDYGLMGGEPKVTPTAMIRAGLESRVLWRNQSSPVPFWPHDIQAPKDKSMVIFDLSDYIFNTLFHQTHYQSNRFSAIDLLPATSSFQETLKFKCTGRPCIGSILSNATLNRLPANAVGDLVFKSKQRPIRLFVDGNRVGNFDGSGGAVEIYGPIAPSGGRTFRKTLLAQMDVGILRGDFVPSLKGNKISGSLKLNYLQFANSPTTQSTLIQDWPSKFVQIASPVLNEMLNIFINQMAQFPISLPAGYECVTPQFTISTRSMRVECDVRYSATSLGSSECSVK